MEGKPLPTCTVKTTKATKTGEDNVEDSPESTASTSTHLYKKNKNLQFVRVNTMEYLSETESISGSSASFGCIHGPEGRQYTTKGLIKRNLIKNLDPIKNDPQWVKYCPPTYGFEIAKILELLIKDPVGHKLDRFREHLQDAIEIFSNGYQIKILDSVSVILDYLADATHLYNYKKILRKLVTYVKKPIILEIESDITKYFTNLQTFYTTLGCILLRLEDDDDFNILSESMIWQLSAPDTARGLGTVRMWHSVTAAAPVLMQTISRMITVSTTRRYRIYVELALILACFSRDNCIYMIEEDIFEHIFYRFNPYFPNRDLPNYDLGPAETGDFKIKLGDSTLHISAVLSLLLVLLKNAKEYLRENPNTLLPCPNPYSLRCFTWAYRFECRAREHHHERNTLTVIASTLIHCYGRRLYALPTFLMADVMSLAVMTEIPRRSGWLETVPFNTEPYDVHFKKLLIHLSVNFLKTFPYNKFMIESRHWLLGLISLLDPALSSLRANWSPALFCELQKIALQALVCTLPVIPSNLMKNYSLIRRLMWYIEWYSEEPYDLSLLYWTVRVLQSVIRERKSEDRPLGVKELFDTHGIIVLTHLCHTLLTYKVPLVERSQAIIALSLRLLTSSIEEKANIICSVYPYIQWPMCVLTLGVKMLNVATQSLERSLIVSDRWLISLMNFIWETIIWNPEYRDKFLTFNGIYKLLDFITITHGPVQCMALALLCDIAKTGYGVGQLVTWRAKLQAANAFPNVVKCGSTIATLLASIFRDECHSKGVRLDENGVIQDLVNPLMSNEVRNVINRVYPRDLLSKRTAICYAACDIAGARMPKLFTLLHLLSEDLENKVSLADEAYKLYKNIQLNSKDEVTLVLCLHYLTAKLQEAWAECQFLRDELEPEDKTTLEEFLQIGKGWAVEVKNLQEEVIAWHKEKEDYEESTLYSFLGRVRLNVALDALRDVRCMARTMDRAELTHGLLHDAVCAHHRRSALSKKIDATILRTYTPMLDEKNTIGQNIKIYPVKHKERVQDYS